MTSGEIKPFVREATGLVRNISIWDSFFANFGGVAIPLALITYTTGPFLFPGSNLVLATLIATLWSIPLGVMYSLYGAAMPRSGGDYVFVSRVVHPIIGFAENFNYIFWVFFFVGFAANFVTTSALSPSILVIGTVSKNSSLVNLANTLAQPTYILAIGLIVIVIFTLIMLRGIRATFNTINAIVILSIIGIAAIIGILAISTNAAFVSDFSRFGSYEKIISTAESDGYSPVGANALYATLGIMPFVYLTTGFANATTFWGGEARSVKKNMFYSQVGVTVLSGLILTVIAALAVNVFGYNFLGSISYLQANGSSAYPFSTPPYFNLFVSILATNPFFLWFLAITYVAADVAPILTVLMVISRAFFAWSFDRVIPTKFASVSTKFNVPAFTIIIIGVIWAIVFAIYTFFSSTFISLIGGATVGENVSLIIIAVTAIIFPFTRKQLFSSSGANYKFGGVPVISIMGVLSLAFLALITYFLVSNPLYGASSAITYETIIALFVLGLIIYGIAYWQRIRNGINIGLAFKEIPPE
jgi:APA family basic amino acid/polyamine antiporter